MPAPIVCDGVPSTAGGGGSLFQGMSFWVSHRVPSRKNILGNVTNNGGKVVAVEKDADMIIADDARKDPPPGSYSWRFIQDCIAQGMLVEKEEYLAGRPPGTTRAVASSEPSKKTRNRFTKEDDAILRDWVVRCEKEGSKIYGNKIYEELEKKHPHHTLQSWRNRWVKKISVSFPQQSDQEVPKTAAAPRPAPSTPPAVPTSVRESSASPTSGRRLRRVVQQSESPKQPDTRLSGVGGPSVVEAGPQRRLEKGRQQVMMTAPTAASEPGPNRKPLVVEDEEDDTETLPITPQSRRKQFYTDFTDFCHASGREVPSFPSVDRKIVNLWDLWESVQSQKVPDSHRDWEQVARDLDLDSRRRNTVNQVRSLYENDLRAFEIAYKDFDNLDGEPDEVEVLELGSDGDNQEEDQEEGVNISMREKPHPSFAIENPSHYLALERLPGAELHSPRLATAGIKRRIGSIDSDSGYPSNSTKKRVRMDREIPSTPDEKLALPIGRPSALGQHGREVSPILGAVSSPAPGKSRAVDPETQDFRYDPDTQMMPEFLHQDESQVTPSQQLHSEFEEVQRLTTPLARTRPALSHIPECAKSWSPSLSTKSIGKLPAHVSPLGQRMPLSTERLSGAAASTNPPQKPSSHRTASPSAADTSSSAVLPSAQPLLESPTRSGRMSPGPELLEEEIDRFVAMGYAEGVVVRALVVATGDPGRAGIVMQALTEGKGIPDNVEGVWTARDDRWLETADAVDLGKRATTARELRARKAAEVARKKLEYKHGEQRMTERRKFMLHRYR